jgi:FMN-dependent NADH-azoreductase
MKNILLVSSSQSSESSHPKKAARVLAQLLQANSPGAEVAMRDLATDPLPAINDDEFAGRTLKPHQRTVAQQAAINLSDALARELAAADVVIIAAATNNRAASDIDAWFDYVIRSSVRFGDPEKGQEVRPKAKKIYLVQARNGIDSPEQMRFQQSHITTVLAGFGLTNVHTIEIEGTAVEESADAFGELPGRYLATA